MASNWRVNLATHEALPACGFSAHAAIRSFVPMAINGSDVRPRWAWSHPAPIPVATASLDPRVNPEA